MLPVLPIVFLLRAVAAGSRGANGSGAPPRYAKTGFTFLWGLLAAGWGLGVLRFSIELLDDAGSGDKLPPAAEVGVAAALALGFVYLFCAWPILRALARRGSARLVHHLGLLCLVCWRTGETRSGAALLAGLALAHRGGATPEQRDWLRARIAKERRTHGTYGTAIAVHQLLEARARRDEGREAEAREHAQTARMFLGTVSYMSDGGLPRGVRRVALELLALDDARCGNWPRVFWGGTDGFVTPIVRVLREWVRARILEGRELPDIAGMAPSPPPGSLRARWNRTRAAWARRRLSSPELEALHAREGMAPPPESREAAHARATATYAALVAGKPVGPRAILAMLSIYDALLHPEFPETLVPEELRADEDAVSAMHEEVARSIASALQDAHVPLHALPVYGPISSRVYHLVETRVLDDLAHALAAAEAHATQGFPEEPFREWMEVSRVRTLWRRVAAVLDTPAAARLWPHFAYVYSNLGVHISETYPRNRPLAYAVFRVCHGDALRFGDQQHLAQQGHNMRVTSGVE